MFNLSVSLKGTIQYQYICSNFVVLCIVNTFAELVRSTEVSSLFRSRCFSVFHRFCLFLSLFICLYFLFISLIFLIIIFHFFQHVKFPLVIPISSSSSLKLPNVIFLSGLQIVGRERGHRGSPPWAWFNRRTIIFYRFCSGGTK